METADFILTLDKHTIVRRFLQFIIVFLLLLSAFVSSKARVFTAIFAEI